MTAALVVSVKALARHEWANDVMREACRAYLKGGAAAYDRVIQASAVARLADVAKEMLGR